MALFMQEVCYHLDETLKLLCLDKMPAIVKMNVPTRAPVVREYCQTCVDACPRRGGTCCEQQNRAGNARNHFGRFDEIPHLRRVAKYRHIKVRLTFNKGDII